MGQKIKKRWFWRKKKTGTRGISPDYESKWKDIAERALKTFLQAFIASIPVDAALLGGGWNVWRAALLSAAAAGVSAVMNFVLAWLREDESEVQ
ncbi:MAG: hypothetical protein J6Z40_11615 [Oscillospiraceae bacterium]|nr:hypothetical protein [Oscillospiraceae bacterium]